MRKGKEKREEQYMESHIDTKDFWNGALGQYQSLDNGRIANSSSSALHPVTSVPFLAFPPH